VIISKLDLRFASLGSVSSDDIWRHCGSRVLLIAVLCSQTAGTPPSFLFNERLNKKFAEQ